MTKEEVKEIACIAWKGAANAHRMYPENKHTFTEYWSGAEIQFNKFCKADVIKSVCEKCRFESECRFKAENVEQNCKFFIDKQTVL